MNKLNIPSPLTENVLAEGFPSGRILIVANFKLPVCFISLNNNGFNILHTLFHFVNAFWTGHVDNIILGGFLHSQQHVSLFVQNEPKLM